MAAAAAAVVIVTVVVVVVTVVVVVIVIVTVTVVVIVIVTGVERVGDLRDESARADAHQGAGVDDDQGANRGIGEPAVALVDGRVELEGTEVR